MIFISHNYKDKAAIEPIAMKLREKYGEDNVFYDSWSIQPGDSIIEEMNNGLEKCKFFLFFVSENSLSSNMVKMEWMNALALKTDENIKFIPVRLDNSKMPAIIRSMLYIDYYDKGLEHTINTLSKVTEGKNTFEEIKEEDKNNLIAYKYKKGDDWIVDIYAQHYVEHNPEIIFVSKEYIDVKNAKSIIGYQIMKSEGNANVYPLNNPTVSQNLPAIKIKILSSIEPHRANGFIFYNPNKEPYNILQVFQIVQKKDGITYLTIPLIEGQKQ